MRCDAMPTAAIHHLWAGLAITCEHLLQQISPGYWHTEASPQTKKGDQRVLCVPSLNKATVVVKTKQCVL
jgi:hypothetical protein